ncbi:GNAT family N-acetyltransferase [Nocardioides plantarum]|uniref:GNAT family N-acetyltransferase n=1 Tax=Nocardioides plantarum TaxID=29299 RepID=A0ABV5K8I5_9ACTN|nr:GNAT family N-acetyltransferase [Nocardioides plantarum]
MTARPAAPDLTVLDDPVGEALRGPHAHLARRHGGALAYAPQVASFAAVPATPTAADWDDLGHLYGAGSFAEVFTATQTPPPSWVCELDLAGFQMVATPATPVAPTVGTDPDVVLLGPADVPEMLALAARTRPGPFFARTIEMGTYVGVRDGGALVAMAGERTHPPGATEISAVCTAPEARGRGLASRLVLDVATRICARGEHPFLHVVDGNPAMRVYEQLGFEVRRPVRFRGFRVPG